MRETVSEWGCGLSRTSTGCCCRAGYTGTGRVLGPARYPTFFIPSGTFKTATLSLQQDFSRGLLGFKQLLTVFTCFIP